jgi:hypothetical protein
MSTGKVNKSRPVLDLLAPTNTDAATFYKPGERSLDDPTAGRIAGFTGDRTLILQRVGWKNLISGEN